MILKNIKKYYDFSENITFPIFFALINTYFTSVVFNPSRNIFLYLDGYFWALLLQKQNYRLKIGNIHIKQ